MHISDPSNAVEPLQIDESDAGYSHNQGILLVLHVLFDLRNGSVSLQLQLEVVVVGVPLWLVSLELPSVLEVVEQVAQLV